MRPPSIHRFESARRGAAIFSILNPKPETRIPKPAMPPVSAAPLSLRAVLHGRNHAHQEFDAVLCLILDGIRLALMGLGGIAAAFQGGHAFSDRRMRVGRARRFAHFSKKGEGCWAAG